MNPFDFASPVRDKELFAGRSRELAELGYYFEHARQQKAIGVVIVGERTSGKSSLLNMASSIAIEKGFLSARIDLTSEDVLSETAFLRTLYEGVMLAARKRQLWGMATEAAYEAFRDAMDAYNPDKLREYCDLSFPRSYAKAMGAGHGLVNFPVSVIHEDLKTILDPETGVGCAGIALLIDEADQLCSLNSMLQKIRHLMAVAEHVIVVLSGTEQMLASMDLAFAPIVRQLKRIRLRPFLSQSETRECLQGRLRKVGQEGILDSMTYRDLHSLAQGHPYEAQLIAHFAYRRYEETPDSGFAISVPVLNDVLSEVERFRIGSDRAIASQLRNYTQQDLVRLGDIILLPRLTLYEKAKISEALLEPGRVKEKITKRRQELRKWADGFVNDKVITYDSANQAYRLNGDQFDRLYLKILARSHRISWEYDERTMPELTEQFVVDQIVRGTEARPYPPFFLENLGRRPVSDHAQQEEQIGYSETRFHEVLWGIERFITSWKFRLLVNNVSLEREAIERLQSNSFLPTIFADLGVIAAMWFGGGRAPTVKATMRYEESERSLDIWLQPSAAGTVSADWGGQVEEYLLKHRPGLEALGWTVSCAECDDEAPGDLRKIVELCRERKWDSVLDHIDGALSTAAIERYLAGDVKSSEAMFNEALNNGTGVDVRSHKNNYAYLLMRKGDLVDARSILEGICDSQSPDRDLSRYNLAICKARLGDLAGATADLKSLQRSLEVERLGKYHAAAVEVIKKVDGGLVSQAVEIRDVYLTDAVNETLGALEVDVH